MHTSGWQFWVFGISETSTYLYVDAQKSHNPPLGKQQCYNTSQGGGETHWMLVKCFEILRGKELKEQ